MTSRSLIVTATIIMAATLTASATTVFQDDFNRPDSPDVDNGWLFDGTNTVDKIVNNRLEVRGGSFSGRGWSYQPITNFAAPYNPTLSANTDVVSWAFNMKCIVVPSGYGLHQSSAAFILASSNNLVTHGSGYAVIFDHLNNEDLTLAKFTGGLDDDTNFTPLIAWDFTGDGSQYFNVRVSYDPADDTWELFATDGADFSDPDAVTTSHGTIVDTTYTGVTLANLGALGCHNAAPKGGIFDNVSVTVAPEPITLSLLAIGGFTLLRRKRSA